MPVGARFRFGRTWRRLSVYPHWSIWPVSVTMSVDSKRRLRKCRSKLEIHSVGMKSSSDGSAKSYCRQSPQIHFHSQSQRYPFACRQPQKILVSAAILHHHSVPSQLLLQFSNINHHHEIYFLLGPSCDQLGCFCLRIRSQDVLCSQQWKHSLHVCFRKNLHHGASSN